MKFAFATILSPAERRAALWMLWLVMAFFYLFVLKQYAPLAGLRDEQSNALGRDFVNVWTAGRLAFESRVAEIFPPAAFRAAVEQAFWPDIGWHIWSYPPPMLAFSLPFGWLGYPAALALWSLLGLAAFVWVAAFAAPDAQEKTPILAARHWPWLLIAPPLIYNLLNGQNGFFTALCALLAVRDARARPLRAGLWLGLLSVKPHLLIALGLCLLAQRQWRALTAGLAFTLIVTLDSILAFGLPSWLAYIEQTVPANAALMWPVNVTDYSYFRMMPTAFAALRNLGLPYGPALALHLILAVSVFLVLLARACRARRPAAQAFLAALAVPLLLPYCFVYDLPFLLGACAWMLRTGEWRQAEWRPAWIVACATLALSITSFNLWPHPLPLAGGWILALAVSPVGFPLRRPAPPPAPPPSSAA